jgi:hypothetical protein
MKIIDFKDKVSMGANIKHTISPMSDAMEMPMEQTFNGEVMHYQIEILKLKDKAIRDALVSLRCTPLEKSKQLFNALRDCMEALEDAQGYVESSGWTRHRGAETAQVESAITNARKALGEE